MLSPSCWLSWSKLRLKAVLKFMFGAREDREMQRLNRLAGLQANFMQQQAAGRAGMASALGSGAMAIASIDS